MTIRSGKKIPYEDSLDAIAPGPLGLENKT
jgi:hypothetical protein